MLGKRSSSPVSLYVAAALRSIRKLKGIPVSQASRVAGIPYGSYSCLENGHYRINLDNLYRMLEALHAEITEVWPSRNGGFLSQARHLPTEEDVIQACSQAFAAEPEVVMSSSRTRRRSVVDARAAAALMVAQSGVLSLKRLARIVDRAPSSMSHMIRRHAARLRTGSPFAGRFGKARKSLAKRFPEVSGWA